MDPQVLSSSRTLHYGLWLLATVALVASLVVWRGRIAAALPRLPVHPGFLGALVLVITLLSLAAPPTGDEPHYLLMTQSLLRDGDLDLRNNYEQRDYLEYLAESVIDPHVNVVGETWFRSTAWGCRSWPLRSSPWPVAPGSLSCLR